jgi:hypothetical protein
MPDFPTYRGELPTCLSPFNLHHYLLLAYWIFFRPTAFKCYLYQADPETYRTAKKLNIFQVKAYRNLFLMMPGTIVWLGVSVSSAIVLFFQLFINIDILEWMRDMAFDMAFGLVFGLAFGVAYGVTFGAVYGVAYGAAGGVVHGIAFGMAFSANVSVVVGVTIGMAVGVAVGAVGGAAFSVMYGVVFGVGFGVVVGVAGGAVVGTASGAAFILGSLHIIFYPINLISLFKYPLLWDELVILPLPHSQKFLTQLLDYNELNGLIQIAEIGQNPFQRWAVQCSLSHYVHQQVEPLHFFYRMFTVPELNSYVFAPIEPKQWEYIPSQHELLLGELAGEWVNIFPYNSFNGERSVWLLTKFFRDRRQTPLRQFAALLYTLYRQERQPPGKILNQTWAQPAYTGIESYPNGLEISRSFAAFKTFLNYQNLAELAQAQQLTLELPAAATAIRPAVITTLIRLGEISVEIATYQAATSRTNKLAALGRANDSLAKLKAIVDTEVHEPERYIIHAIIDHWQPLIIAASGELGRFTITKPIPNPYVAGNPVTGSLFVGREDILQRLEELWSVPGQCPSVVLYGHRRMGKSSILHNLTAAQFGQAMTIVDFNMQRVGFVNNTNELLYTLALACYDEIQPTTINEPTEAQYQQHNPYTAFDRFLKQLDKQNHNRRLLITIDEFELLEAAIQAGRLEAHLLDYWRALIQTYPWFIMVLAGLHELEEMRHDYWHPLFGSVTAIRVSFLTPAATRQLLIQPALDFPLDYDEAAIDAIIQLTNGQPYLVQLIAHSLVTRFNRQTFEQGVERARRLTLADVEAVITTAEFFIDGNAYFAGIWQQARTASQHHRLTQLAQTGTLECTDQLSLEDTNELQHHDIIYKDNEGCWKFTVELMRRWVVNFSPYQGNYNH